MFSFCCNYSIKVVLVRGFFIQPVSLSPLLPSLSEKGEGLIESMSLVASPALTPDNPTWTGSFATTLNDEIIPVKKNTLQSEAIYEKQGDSLKYTSTNNWDGLPVRVRGAFTNKPFVTAITWSERPNPSCKRYWWDRIWKYSVIGNIS